MDNRATDHLNKADLPQISTMEVREEPMVAVAHHQDIPHRARPTRHRAMPIQDTTGLHHRHHLATHHQQIHG